MLETLMSIIPEVRCSKSKKSVSVTCSCTECDSSFCFAKRRLCSSCTCEECEKSKTCLYYDNKKRLKDCASDQIYAVYLSGTKSATVNRNFGELSQSDINYEEDRKKVIESNQPPPNSIDEYISKLLLDNIPSHRYRNKPESLSKYVDIISGKTQLKTKQETLKKYIKDLKERRPQKSSLTVCRCNALKAELDRKSAFSKASYKGKSRISCDRNITQVQSVMLSGPRMDLTSAAAKLSTKVYAQNYSNLYSCRSPGQPSYSENKSENKNDTYDLLKKIKEVYKACSCKICECMPTNAIKNNPCKCKPCECSDCTRYMDKFKLAQPLDTKLTCSRYDCERKKFPHRKQKDCSCKPCECALCQTSPELAKSCDCDACQCLQCTPTLNRKSGTQTTIVDTLISENYQHNPCDCSPCDCIRCTRGYFGLSNLLHDISAVTNRPTHCNCEECVNNVCVQGLGICKCEKNSKSVTSKPVRKGSAEDLDYQIASIINDIYHSDDTKNSKRQDMITMFYSLPPYPKITSPNLKKKYCTCGECECITCVCKEDTFNAIKSSRLFPCDKRKTTIDRKTGKLVNRNECNICDCTPCECQVCTKHKRIQSKRQNNYKSSEHTSSCRCNVCDCVDECLGKAHGYKCKCSTCRCERCFGDEFVPSLIKKGDVLTPSAHQTKVRNIMLAKSNLPATSPIFKTGSLQKISSPSKTRRDHITNYVKISKSKPNYTDGVPKLSVAMQAPRKGNDTELELIKSTTDYNNSVIKSDAFVQCREFTLENPLLRNNLIDKTSDSYISVYSSIESASKTSFCKETDNMRAILGNENNSWQSSLNSSGHDHPDYLIRFPESTVETCLEDDFNSTLDNDIKRYTSSKRNTAIPERQHFSQIFGGNVTEIIESASTSIATKENHHTYETKNTERPISTSNKYLQRCNFTNQSSKDCNTKHDKGVSKFISKLNNNGHHRDRYDLIQNLNQLHLANDAFLYYNFSNDRITDFMRDDDAWTKPKQPSFTCFENNVGSSNMDDDYKRVSKTLQDAKEFSVHLLKLLETYEKANKDFEKVSDKLKVSQASIFNGDFPKTKNMTCDVDRFNESEIKTPSLKDVSTLLSTFSKEQVSPDQDSARETISQKLGLTNLSNSETNAHSKTNQNNKVNVPQIELTFEKIYDDDDTGHKSKKRHMILSVSKDNLLIQEAKNIKKSLKNKDVKKDEKNRKKCCKHHKIMKRTIIITKKVCMKKPALNNTPSAESMYLSVLNDEKSPPEDTLSDDKNEIQPIKPIQNHKLNAHTENVCHVSTSNFKINNQNSASSTNEALLRTNMSQLLEVSSLASTPSNKKGVYVLPPSEVEAKSTVTVQTNSLFQSKNEVSYNQKKALNQLQLEIKKLLELACLQPKHHADIEPEIQKELSNDARKGKLELELKEPQKLNKETVPLSVYVDREVFCDDLPFSVKHSHKDIIEKSIEELHNNTAVMPAVNEQSKPEIAAMETSCSYDSCEGQKVKFLGVRRVSDHTVLVKWDQPRDLSEVRGYELLVDGRAVHKVFNPSQCMAVVTCLPHTDKILLTIRTITVVVSEAGHYPATTIIYRPRVK